MASILSDAFSGSIRHLRDRWYLAPLLALGELIFLVLSSWLFFVYQVRILTGFNAIMDELSTVPENLDTASAMDLLGQADFGMVIRTFREIQGHLIESILVMLAAFIAFELLSWLLASGLVHSEIDIGKYILDYAYLTLIFFVPLGIVWYLFASPLFSLFTLMEMGMADLWVPAIVSVPTLYLYYVAIARLPQRMRNPWERVKDAWRLGTRKAVPLILADLVVIAAIALSSLLVTLSVESNLLLIALTVLLLVCVICYSRLFFAGFVRELAER
ncbi:hypothetical protein JXB02_04385 [Candidatus Woesearchaeota archaeon]|nr:hypothetical protein [Candidatus Woesearchaeota archaeon]